MQPEFVAELQIEKRLAVQAGVDYGVGADGAGKRSEAGGHEPRDQITATPEVASAAGGGDEVLNGTKLEFEEGVLSFVGGEGGDDSHVVPDSVVGQAGFGREKAECGVVFGAVATPQPPVGEEMSAPFLVFGPTCGCGELRLQVLFSGLGVLHGEGLGFGGQKVLAVEGMVKAVLNAVKLAGNLA